MYRSPQSFLAFPLNGSGGSDGVGLQRQSELRAAFALFVSSEQKKSRDGGRRQDEADQVKMQNEESR